MTTTLPFAPMAEQSLLGAILLKPDLLGWLEVGVHDFHVPANRSVWNAMLALHEREIAIDEVTLVSELENMQLLTAIGGIAYLGRLATTVPTSANAASYAATLTSARVSRDVMRVAGAILDKAQRDNCTGEELLDEAVSSLAQVTRTTANEVTDVASTLRELVHTMIDEVDDRANGISRSNSILPTGIDALDQRIVGVPLGTVTAIAGRPGSGKSSLLLNVSEHAANLGKRVVIFTTEDRRDRWNERLIAKHAKLNVERVYGRTLGPRELSAAAAASDKLSHLKNLHIVHAHGMGAQEMARIATSLSAEVVAVDYIQKLKPPTPKAKLHEAIEENAKRLGDFAGKSGAGVLVASQLSKDVEKEQRRPTTADLRYGDGLVQEAKLILLLNNPNRDENHSEREIVVAKRNQGESDMLIRVQFEGAQCRFV